MLAYALLAVVAAAERADNPPPDGLIPLTCNEIHHLLNVLIARPIRDLRHRLAGQPGDDDINTAPRPSTTSAEPPTNHGDHDLRLSY